MLNHVDIEANLINYAIAGGNLEIIHICQQKKMSNKFIYILIRCSLLSNRYFCLVG